MSQQLTIITHLRTLKNINLAAVNAKETSDQQPMGSERIPSIRRRHTQTMVCARSSDHHHKKCFQLKKFTKFSENRINYRTNSLEI